MDKKKKILFCTPYDLSAGSGIARCSHHIIEYYNENNISEVDLKLLPMDRLCSFPDRGIFKNIRRLISGFVDYSRIIKNIKKELDKDDYDVVHIASSASISLLKDYICLEILRKKNIDSVIHFHFGRIPDLSKANNWEWKLILKIAKLATKIVVIDGLSYKVLKDNINNVEYLPNPLSPATEQMIEQNKGAVREKDTILFVGHVIRTKGVFELVEACSKMQGIKLKIVGLFEENTKDELISIFNCNNNPNSIEFTGNIPAEGVVKEMLKCSVFVLPTYTEGFPNVILESMACACPIITTKVGAIPEMLDVENANDCAICIEPKDIDGLKNAIDRMMNDADFAFSCGEKSKKRVKAMYSMPIVWKQMCSIWENM